MYNYVTNINVTITISCGNSPLGEITIISLVTRTRYVYAIITTFTCLLYGN